jgi:16S rRNA (uracil1498-N3)-methyltransferase
MGRFYVPPSAVRGRLITITGGEAHHILDVMRLKALDKVVAFDGTGREYIGFIKDTKRKSLTVEIVETRTPLGKETSKVTLIQAIPKKEKMDYIVEKATELGVSSIIPVITRRTIVSWGLEKKLSSAARWRRIATSAAKQCGRTDIPAVSDVKDFQDLLKDAADYDLKLIAALSDDTVRLKSVIKDFKGGKLAAAIGPEGDFTPSEVDSAVKANFRIVSLGRRVLKSDTAGLAVLAVLNYELTDG